ncbi:ATP-binding protein [Uliginosibacterium gangwonense]|uniref:ATP-binding protein n=1 Tax=Uliginosibacterium gangwonense TaxID=392736 RepID=UPI00035E9212|nr:ATP-binding protein [Uliginosibacterium gangwonense]
MLSDSLKRRVVLLCLLVLGVIWILALGLSYLDARKEIQELLDAHLVQTASLIAAHPGAELDEVETEHLPDTHHYTQSIGFQIWAGGKTLGLHSTNAPKTALGTQVEGFSERTVDGSTWRVFSIWDHDHDNLIQVGEKLASRQHLLRELVEKFLQPVLYALPILALLLWFAVRMGLRPLDRVAGEIANRHPQRLDAVATDGAPTEIRPLIVQLNHLLARVGESLDNTRRFTADAAHELRTPLAAIRAQAQVARQSTQADEQQHALRQVLQACDLATHVIEQLLTLARLDGSSAPEAETINLRELAASVIAELIDTALAKHIDVALEDGPAPQIALRPGLMRMLLRNLLDNAIRYSPAGSEVSLSITTHPDAVVLDVADNGPGIPAEQRARIFDRFYRIVGSNEAGSGLGLSIAQRVADIHGGRIEALPNPVGHGSIFRINLPIQR